MIHTLRAFFCASFIAAFLCASAELHAQAKTVTYVGTGTGTVNGVSFTNASYNFAVTYDPSLPLVFGAYDITSAMMTLNGFNSGAAFNVTGASNEYVLYNGSFTEFVVQGSTSLWSPGQNSSIINPYQFQGWDGVSAATFLSPMVAFNQFVGIDTSLGRMTMTTATMSSFSVSGAAVPEPSTYAALLGLCSLGFVAYRRHTARGKLVA